MLRLPKDIAADPLHDELVKLLESNRTPLWEKSEIQVATVPPTRALTFELRRCARAQIATQGLEQIAKDLEKEQKGLDALAQKTSTTQNPRVSRVLFVANDGAERFYRECEALMSRYKQRLMICRLSVSGEDLGEAIFGAPKLVRAIMIFDKKAASKALLALLK